MPVCLNFRGLAKGHHPSSERGIIAAETTRSTNNFNYLGSVAIVASSSPKSAVPGYLNALNPVVKIPVSAEFWRRSAPASGQAHFRDFSLADLVDVGRAGIDRSFTIRHPLAVDSHRALLDHAKRLGGAGHETGFF